MSGKTPLEIALASNGDREICPVERWLEDARRRFWLCEDIGLVNVRYVPIKFGALE